MKYFAVTFNRTDEYGNEYGESLDNVFGANTKEDIIKYLIDTYMPKAKREEFEDITTLSVEIDGYPPLFTHEILIYEVELMPLTEKVFAFR